MSTWTFFDPAGTNITPSPPPTGTITLVYGADGRPTIASQTIGTCICESTSSASLILTPGGTNIIDINATRITKVPITAPSPTFSGNGDPLGITFAVPSTGEWSWDFDDEAAVAVALKVKVKVKRPPIDPR